jgi:thymidylate synthase (FAD)
LKGEIVDIDPKDVLHGETYREGENRIVVNLLNAGFVELIEPETDLWGGDHAIYRAAKMSRGEVPQESTHDQRVELFTKLLSYDPPHMTPFEFSGMIVHIHAPIFVARQLVRHRLVSWMEKSLRYCEADAVFYLPSAERVAPENEQSPFAQKMALRAYRSTMNEQLHRYDELTNDGWPQEVARSVLGVGLYTEWHMQANLREWLHILELRSNEHAQWETREYARAFAVFLKMAFPAVCEALVEAG